MDERYAARLRVRFETTELPAGVLAHVVAAIDAAGFQCAQEDLAFLRQELREFPVLIDAGAHRLSKQRGAGALITSAQNGSIVLLGLIAGAYWLLDKTLGETVKEAWTASPAHAHIFEVLTRRRPKRLRKVAEQIERTSGIVDGNWAVRVRADVVNDDTIEVDVHVLPAEEDTAA
jgi:hypothetical protein